MAHTWQHGNTIFIGNSDLSGDIKLVDARTKEPIGQVAGADLIDFIAGHVRRCRINALEQASTDEILGLPNGTV
jgi:hypothetical protein